MFVRLPLCTSTMPYGRVHVERLRLLLFVGVAAGRVAHVAEPHGSEQAAHVTGAVGLTHLAAGALHVDDAAVGGRDTGRVLAAVLQQTQGVVDLLVDGVRRDDADDAAHVAECSPEKLTQGTGQVRLSVPHVTGCRPRWLIGRP